MKRLMIMVVGISMAGVPFMSGCGKTLKDDATVKQNPDGTATKDETKVTQQPNGDVVKTEEKSKG